MLRASQNLAQIDGQINLGHASIQHLLKSRTEYQSDVGSASRREGLTGILDLDHDLGRHLLYVYIELVIRLALQDLSHYLASGR